MEGLFQPQLQNPQKSRENLEWKKIAFCCIQSQERATRCNVSSKGEREEGKGREGKGREGRGREGRKRRDLFKRGKSRPKSPGT